MQTSRWYQWLQQSKHLLALSVCLAVLNLPVAHAGTQTLGQLSPMGSEKMLSEFKRMSESADVMRPAKIVDFLKRNHFECDTPLLNKKGVLRAVPIECQVNTVADESIDAPTWPTLILGISQQRVVAASMDTAEGAPKKWRCDQSPGHAPICFHQKSNQAQQKYWLKRWDALFKAAN